MPICSSHEGDDSMVHVDHEIADYSITQIREGSPLAAMAVARPRGASSSKTSASA